MSPGQGRSRREVVTAALLFAATVLSTTFAGMQQALTEADVAASFPGGLPAEGAGLLAALRAMAVLVRDHWPQGLPFSATLLAILGTHELGHFFAGRRQRIDVSLPYFIPAPTLIGTFGAVIRIRGPLWHRSGLIAVGAAGPLAGFAIAVPAYCWGMAHSTVIDGAQLGEAAFRMGDSLATWGIQRAVFGALPAGSDVLLHPVAFAGWIGFFVTGLNLIPMGQFDGGHIVYGLSPARYRTVARAAFVVLLALGLVGWKGWLFWGAIALLLGADRHPPTMLHEERLPLRRRRTAWASIAVFVLTFVPQPFMIG